MRRYSFLIALSIGLCISGVLFAAGQSTPDVDPLLRLVPVYANQPSDGILTVLTQRAQANPFHLVTLLFFLGAICHTFMANRFTAIAHRLADEHKARRKRLQEELGARFKMVENLERDVSFRAEIMHFLGEIEVVFGMWVLPLLFAITYYYDWGTAIAYIESRNYTEPLFVVVVMSLASTRPIIKLAESALDAVAGLGGGTPSAWWLSILIIGPLLGSLITEPAAMTISAILLAKHIYALSPSTRLSYGTLGLLFVNVSVGGVLTHFAAPPVLMVASPWDWDTPFMFMNFGWKAVIGILISTSFYFVLFRSELAKLNGSSAIHKEGRAKSSTPVPLWITLVHIILLALVVVHSHHPAIFIGCLLIFLGFYQATAPHQTEFSLRPALLVGLFLAGLVIHGGLQGWWISPLLERLTDGVLMKLAIVLTAFNDNAAITFLTTLSDGFTHEMKYAVVAGAVTGGGLTVIANAPNPAGQSLLSRYFENGVHPLYLLVAALTPTVILALCFSLL